MSEAGCSSSKGFSLLEMLVVILVVGILYSLAGSMLTLTISDPLNEEVDRLRERIGLAQDESLVRSQALAVGFDERGYAFFAQDDDQQWSPIEKDALLGRRRLLNDFVQTVYLQGQAVILPAEGETHPQVFILPTGEMLPFEWHLRSASGQERSLRFDAQGRLLGTTGMGGSG